MTQLDHMSSIPDTNQITDVSHHSVSK